MIQLNDPGISAKTAAFLAAKQADINAVVDLEQRVAKAKADWKAGKNNAAFREIKKQLTAMCSGAKRCCYCEDSASDEIEHIQPKDIYPECTFEWTNYLYACGPCNGPKGNNFSIIHHLTDEIIDPRPVKGLPRKAPPRGTPLFISPRLEDPMDYLWLDLATFVFTQVNEHSATEEYQRAEYTLDILRLNSRDHLVEARQNAYEHFRNLLEAYISARDRGDDQAELDNRIATIHKSPHLTVWNEMKRQYPYYPQLNQLFTSAPEALTW